jgi:hypothetical protein
LAAVAWSTAVATTTMARKETVDVAIAAASDWCRWWWKYGSTCLQLTMLLYMVVKLWYCLYSHHTSPVGMHAFTFFFLQDFRATDVQLPSFSWPQTSITQRWVICLRRGVGASNSNWRLTVLSQQQENRGCHRSGRQQKVGAKIKQVAPFFISLRFALFSIYGGSPIFVFY